MPPSSALKLSAEFLESSCGYSIPDTDYPRMDAYIAHRCAELGIQPQDYAGELFSNKTELQSFINEATINETYFFRERRHFLLLKDILSKRGGDTKTNIWSAACSTGEEPLSIAAVVKKIRLIDPLKKIKIFASDINTDALEIFRAGKYKKRSFREDGSELHKEISLVALKNDSGAEASKEVLSEITIIKKNLLSDNLNDLPLMDIILLRNILIYMKGVYKEKILTRVLSRLNSNGVLFVSATETSLIKHESLSLFETDGVYYFIKK